VYARIISLCLLVGIWGPLFGQTPGPTVAVSYQTTADWGSGFNGSITLRNDSAFALVDWTLEMTFDREIHSMWDARIASRTGPRYLIRGMEYNKVIEPGRAVTFGFG